MSIAAVFYRVGWLLVFLAGGMIVPLLVALYGGERAMMSAFLIGGAAAAFCGVGLVTALRSHRTEEGITTALGFLTVGWLVVPVFAAVPFFVGAVLPDFNDAYFEAVSALTTTGATLLRDPGQAPDSVVAWRAMMQWLGGLGTLVMASVVMDFLFWRGVPLANVPVVGGRQQSSLMARLGATLWLILPIYGGLTGLVLAPVLATGVPPFDALCVTLATVSTGGMMPVAGGLEAYDAPFAPGILGLAMAISGLNVMLHWYGARGRFTAYWKDVEAGHYVLFLVTAMVVAMVVGTVAWPGDTPSTDWAAAAFTAVSLVSTTGLLWQADSVAPALPTALVLALVGIGGSALSTAGGLKIVRLVLLTKHGRRELARLSHPNGVAQVVYGRMTMDEEVLSKVGAVFIAAIIVFAALSAVLAGFGMPLEHALAAAIAALSNAGPAFILATGVPEGFQAVPEGARWLLGIAMVVGRLEVLGFLAVVNPGYWMRL